MCAATFHRTYKSFQQALLTRLKRPMNERIINFPCTVGDVSKSNFTNNNNVGDWDCTWCGMKV